MVFQLRRCPVFAISNVVFDDSLGEARAEKVGSENVLLLLINLEMDFSELILFYILHIVPVVEL